MRMYPPPTSWNGKLRCKWGVVSPGRTGLLILSHDHERVQMTPSVQRNEEASKQLFFPSATPLAASSHDASCRTREGGVGR